MNEPSHYYDPHQSLRVITLKAALEKFALGILFIVTSIPAWVLVWGVIFCMMPFPAVRDGRILLPEGFTYERFALWYAGISLAVATSIFLFGLIGMIVIVIHDSVQVASLQDSIESGFWRVCLFPAFMAASGMRNWLQAVILLCISHKRLLELLSHFYENRYPVSALEAAFPCKHYVYKEALLALPGMQLLDNDYPFFLISSRLKARIGC